MTCGRLARRLALGVAAVAGFVAVSTGVGWLVVDGPLAPAPPGVGPSTLPIGGPFALTDHRGRAVTERDFRGRPMAIFFGFTYCPDVCPTTLGALGRFIEALGPAAARLHWVFVSVDAGRDTPGGMARYLESFDPRIVGLTGDEAAIAQAAQGFRVAYRRVPLEGGGYTMDHTASIFLLDAEGRFAGTIDPEENERTAVEKLRMLAGEPVTAPG